MEIDVIWLLILAASAPISGVVGFAIQLRNVKNLRLQNEKLELEIDALKKGKDSRLYTLTPEEILQYSGQDKFNWSIKAGNPPAYKSNVMIWRFLTVAIAVLALLIFVLV